MSSPKKKSVKYSISSVLKKSQDSKSMSQLTMLRVLTVSNRRRPNIRRSLSPSSVASLIGMPFRFAVIAKERVTTGTFALQLRTTGTLRSYDSKTAIRSRTPPNKIQQLSLTKHQNNRTNLVSGSTASTLRTIKSSYFSNRLGLFKTLLISERKTISTTRIKKLREF